MKAPTRRPIDASRRRFLQAAAAASGGLLIGFKIESVASAETTEQPVAFTPNAFIRIAPDNTVTLVLHKSEMGQGVRTALPTILAEELDADLDRVSIEMADEDPAFYGVGFPGMLTGGSTSVRLSWDSLAQAGATARAMLIGAAAKTWGVAATECRTEIGRVVGPNGAALTYGQLANLAAKMPVPDQAPRKQPAAYNYIGKPLPRRDNLVKVTGQAMFGIDVEVPGMLTAVVIRPPVFGGRVRSFDATAAKRMADVRDVVQTRHGIGVLAGGYWAARQAADKVRVEWDSGPNADNGDAGIAELFARELQKPGEVARREGDVEAALADAERPIEATYQVPFLAHATLEPMNCTADVRLGRCEIWVPTQGQTNTRRAAATLLGISPAAVTVHTTYLGGGFGRRGEIDFVEDAVELSQLAGAPVKVIWSREDDIRHDFYRPASRHRLCAALGNGRPQAWHHQMVGPSIWARVSPGQLGENVDRTSVEGARNLPYAIPNLQMEYRIADAGVPVGYWRSVGSSHNAFVVESFIDELARAAGADPVAFRLDLLQGAPRHAAVLERATQAAGWGKPLPAGRFQGAAVHESYGSFAAQVAEVSVADSGEVRVHKVACAIDCGRYVNPDIVAAQMEGGIVYGLTAALMGKINIERGGVKQSNFHDYPLLRFDRMPRIEVHILDSGQAPGGAGEPGTPPIAPAVCNAIFAATGVRIRELPIDAELLRRA